MRVGVEPFGGEQRQRGMERLIPIHFLQVFTVLVAVLIGPISSRAIAGAACVGPHLVVEQTTVAPGAAFTVRGSSFGTACHDAGPPPEGEGVLGLPQTGIELKIVQGDQAQVVALGAADRGYGFNVEIVAPPDMSPGTAQLTSGGGAFPIDLTISDAPPPPEANFEVATFGPESASDGTEEVAGSVTGPDTTELAKLTTQADGDDPVETDPDDLNWLLLTPILILGMIGGVAAVRSKR